MLQDPDDPESREAANLMAGLEAEDPKSHHHHPKKRSRFPWFGRSTNENDKDTDDGDLEAQMGPVMHEKTGRVRDFRARSLNPVGNVSSAMKRGLSDRVLYVG